MAWTGGQDRLSQDRRCEGDPHRRADRLSTGDLRARGGQHIIAPNRHAPHRRAPHRRAPHSHATPPPCYTTTPSHMLVVVMLHHHAWPHVGRRHADVYVAVIVRMQTHRYFELTRKMIIQVPCVRLLCPRAHRSLLTCVGCSFAV
jgi:hypothetical protein